MTADAPSTRDRLIATMLQAMQRKGLHGVGLTELLAQAQAPKGVLYHHFPGGKTELAVAAIEAAAAHMGHRLAQLLERPEELTTTIDQWMTQAQHQLARSDYELGCPMATVALESTAEDTAVRTAIAQGFETLRQQLGHALAQRGLTRARARMLATTMVAAYEGALIQARVAGSPDAMRDTTRGLVLLLQTELAKTSA